MERDPRPNWQDYSQWPGLYGANDDFVTGQEAAELRAFKAAAKQDPRYRHLILDPSAALAPYSENFKGSIEERPNFRLTMLLSRLNARRLARVLQQKRFERFGETWLFLAMGCLPDDLTRARIEEWIGGALSASGGNSHERVLALAGITSRDWSMRYRKAPIPGAENGREKAVEEFAYSEGFSDLSLLVAHQMMESLGADDPKLAAIYLKHKYAAPGEGNHELAQTGTVPVYGRLAVLDTLGIPARGLGAKDLCDALAERLMKRQESERTPAGRPGSAKKKARR